MKDDKFNACMGIIFSIIVVGVVSALMNGWALSKVWNWFMPAIFNLTALTMWKAIGVAMVIGLFTGSKGESDNSKHDTFGEIVIYALMKAIIPPVVTVFLAWIVWQLAF